MNLDMSINGGGIGGSSGLLDWGSDIARMWGIGMQTGANLANMMRDLKYRSVIEPGEIEAKYMQNENAKMGIQNQYTKEYIRQEANNARLETMGGVYDASKQQSYQGIVETNPQNFQRAMATAPRNSTGTTIPNGMNNAGYTNAQPSAAQTLWRVPPNMNSALNQGMSNQYGNGGA